MVASKQRKIKGILGKKLGMTQIWDKNNKLIPISVIQADANIVTQVYSLNNNTYSSYQIAYSKINARKANKPMLGHFAKSGVSPHRHLAEVRTSNPADYTVGQKISVEQFTVGQKVDVIGKTKGKGFAGTMKRHGFSGAVASHGAHKNHRKQGSIGGAATPGRVFLGQKMSGRMGNVQHTVQNLIIYSIDTEKNLLLVKGSIPGPRGSVIFVRTAVKGAQSE